ncbi:putative ribonuclease H-like domain-containing protein [Tanacetum coccineum]
MKKMYCLVVTDDYSRFTWVFFLATKDETSGILKSFVTGIENLVDHKVKVIRFDNGTEFKNREMNQFCEMKVSKSKDNWKPKRKDTRVPQPSGPTDIVVDEAVHKEMGDSLVRVATTASSLEAEQDSGNINKTRSKATLNEPSSPGTSSGSGPRGNTLRSDEDRIKLNELMELSKVESSDDEESLGKDASKQGRINAIDADEDITLVSVHDMNVSANEEVGEKEVFEVINTAKLIIDAAQVSAAGDKVSTTGAATTGKSQSQDKGKGILVEEPVKPAKKKDQIRLDEEASLRLQAEFDEEERLARDSAQKEQEEANIALIETWDDVQSIVDDDYQLPNRLQAKEQEQFTIKEKATLFKELLEQRRKHFAAKRSKEAFKRVNTFEDFRTELVEGKEKRARAELVQESTKRQKVDKDKDTTELQSLMKVIPDE